MPCRIFDGEGLAQQYIPKRPQWRPNSRNFPSLFNLITRIDTITWPRVVLNLLIQFHVAVSIYTVRQPRHHYAVVCSKEPYTWSPLVLRSSFRIHYNMVWERVCIGCRDGRNVIFVAVYNSNNFMCSFFKRLAHGATNFDNVCMSQSKILSF